MKKIIFLTLALALTFVGTAWGQSTTAYFEATPVFNTNYPFVYDGTPKTYITSYTDNCDQTAGDPMGNTATDAGSYTATISSQCYGHGVYGGSGGTDYYEEFHVGSVTYNWSILPRDISKDYTDYDVDITVTNQKWTGSAINISAVYTIKFKGADLLAADYDVYVTKEETPTTIKDEGRYTIVFTGKGNFTGTVTKTFDVKKEMSESEATTGIHFDIPTQLITTADYDFTAVVTDKKSHTTLYEGTDFELHFFNTEAKANDYKNAADAAAEATALAAAISENAIKTAGEAKYWAVATGIAPKYQGKVVKTFYVVKDVQTYEDPATDATKKTANVSLHITKPGYPVAEDSPNKAIELGEMNVGDGAAGAAVATDAKRVFIPKDFTKTVTDAIKFNVVGIENKAFAGCNEIRYIDATNIQNYTPSSLNREAADGPFASLPKQTLVYLTGATVEGENYIYNTEDETTPNYVCETYKVYDDNKGIQTGFSNAIAAKWDVMIPMAFTANSVTNTRKMVATAEVSGVAKQQGYTVYLPYEVSLPTNCKAYTMKYSKTDQLGFVEAELTNKKLKAMTPYVLIPTVSGQFFNAENVAVSKTFDVTEADFISSIIDATAAVSGQTTYKFIGNMKYMEKADAKDKYIMQKANEWKLIADDASGYAESNPACILAMRAYVEQAGAAPARLYSIFENADGSTTVIEGLEIDADTKAEIYDLQGRKVAAPQRGGLYIINGKKVVMK